MTMPTFVTVVLDCTWTAESPITISRAIDDKSVMARYLQASPSHDRTARPMHEIGKTAPLFPVLGEDGQPTFYSGIPGNHAKGKFRRFATSIIAEALGRPFTLDDYYFNAIGGISFGAKSLSRLDVLHKHRFANPVSALFGTAVMQNQGCARIGHAVSTTPVDLCVALIEAGHRKDDFINDADAYMTLSAADKAFLAKRQECDAHIKVLSGVLDKENKQLKALEKKVGKENEVAVKAGLVAQIEALQVSVKSKEAELEALKDAKENTIERPLDDYWAIVPGTRLKQSITLSRVTPAEAGLFMAVLRRFSEEPRVGGRASLGYGMLSGQVQVSTLQGGRKTNVGRVTIGDGCEVEDPAGVIATWEAAWGVRLAELVAGDGADLAAPRMKAATTDAEEETADA